MESDLVHSVAFRVTEAEWLKLQKRAQQEGTSIPQLAKAALFEKMGFPSDAVFRRYGQKASRKRS